MGSHSESEGHGRRWAELAESPLRPHGEGRELTGATASAHCRGTAARRAHRADTEPLQGLHGALLPDKSLEKGEDQHLSHPGNSLVVQWLKTALPLKG